MRNLIGTLLTISLVITIGTTVAAQTDAVCRRPDNLLTNGNFQLGQNNQPDGWSFDSYAGAAVPLWTLNDPRHGNRSVEISSSIADDARWTQPVTAIQQNSPYFLSGWIKTEHVAHSQQPVDAGANISLFGGFTSSPGIFGTRNWTPTGVLFNSQSDTEVTVAARLGFFAGTTTGTAWFDNLSLRPLVPVNPHPRWKILVLIYRQTDFMYSDGNGAPHHVTAAMTNAEVQQAADSAREFVTKDIPELSAGNMLPTLTIKRPAHALSSLTPDGMGWWPAPADTAADHGPEFDSVIVIWDPNATDQATGQPIWIGSEAGLTPSMGTTQTYSTLIVDAATSYGHRNVLKHEFGHSLLFFFSALGTTPTPTVDNHAVAGQYVNCVTGAQYVWQDETTANPIPNSIYNNQSGFTHDYYSGLVAEAGAPTRCLGIVPDAWARGGPVSHSESEPVFTAEQRVRAIGGQVNGLVSSGTLAAEDGNWLHGELANASWSLANNHQRLATLSLSVFIKSIQWLVLNQRLPKEAGDLILAAAQDAGACA
jgi:hypothetical protein